MNELFSVNGVCTLVESVASEGWSSRCLSLDPLWESLSVEDSTLGLAYGKSKGLFFGYHGLH